MTSGLVCADGVQLLMDYLEDLLSAETRGLVDAHLGGCPRCVAFVESYLATPRILRAATQVEMPGEARDSLRRFLDRRRN